MARRALGLLLPLGLCLGGELAARGAAVPGKVDFNFQVRPLLSDRCFKCHGPDEKSRKAKLRLDRSESAYSVRGEKPGRRALAPRHPERSEMYRRIMTSNADEQMPPPNSGLVLNAGEKELIRRWIEQGAEYKPHWSLIPVGRPKAPAPRARARVRNPIDAFVAEGLEAEGLALAPEA